MPVLKQRHTKDFTVVPNDLLRNRKISLRDIGLLVWMLSKPHDWKFTYDGMLSELGTDGKAALQKSVKALQTAGYIKIEKTRRKGKLSESIWYVYDSPHIENQYMVNQPQMQIAAKVSPHIDSPYTVNRPVLLNKDITKDTATKNAVPALEGGVQRPNGFYFDEVSGAWRRKESP